MITTTRIDEIKCSVTKRVIIVEIITVNEVAGVLKDERSMG